MFVTTPYFKIATRTALFAVLLMIGLLLSASTVFAQGPVACQLTDAEHNIDKVAESADGGNHWPGVRKLTCGGVETGAFCVDALVNTTSEDNGAIYNEATEALSCEVQWLILNYPPDLAGLSVEEVGARNGAIWSFTDPLQRITQPTARANRVQEILNSMPADACAALPQPATLSFKPLDDAEKLVNDTFDLTLEAKDGNGAPLAGMTINLSTTFGDGVPPTVTTDSNGEASFSISSTAFGSAGITATLDRARQAVTKMIAASQQALGRIKNIPETAQATAQVEWVEAATLTIIKETNLGNSPIFDFDGDLGSFGLAHGDSKTFTEVDPGTYILNEDIASFPDVHWELIDVTCEDQNGEATPVEFEMWNATADITVAAGQQVRCTFKNERSDFEPPANEYAIYLPLVIKVAP